MITYNDNPYLTWWRNDCYQYAIQNKHPQEFSINVLITMDDFSESFTLDYMDTRSFTLPGDGTYEVTVTAIPFDEEAQATVYEDLLVEICSIQWCLLRLLQQLYCKDCAAGSSLAGNLIGDPCKRLCRESGLTAGQGGVQADYSALRLALVQLKSMLFAYMTHIYEYQLGYLGLDVPPEVRSQKAQIIQNMWQQILAFTASCGFDCTKGSAGTAKKCTSC